jgi:hypothetical protein
VEKGDVVVMPVKLMNRKIAFWTLLGIVLAIGCSSTTEPYATEEFAILVDSISAPDTISWGEPFLVRVWAIVGPDLCHKFSKFEPEWQGPELHVDVVGVQPTGPAGCATMISQMRGVGFAVNPPYPGEEFDLVFEARGGELLRHTVTRAQ